MHGTCVCVTADENDRLVKAAMPAKLREALEPYLADATVKPLQLRA